MSGKLQPTAEEINEETSKFQAISNPQLQESEYVHDVYNHIANHFSQTRYKPWPIVTDFLETRDKYSLGLDVGCGNGKYLNINSKLYMIGSDHSSGLVNQAKSLHKGEINNDLVLSDGLTLPHPTGLFDFAISIAVIHHFSTEERRIQAIVEILRCLHKGGQALIYCWALEQENSRRGWKEGMDQDVLVPWVLSKNQPKTPKAQKAPKRKNHKNKKISDSENQEQGNTQSEQIQEQEQEKEKEQEKQQEILSGPEPVKSEVRMRYYHLYKKNELKENAESAGGKVVRDGYERDNWWVVVEKL
ncbi:hypothetical protein B5S33_g2715 [[Candida] boidinii]|nr:hypothetical protein B5S30_g5588 [[Candida] boidinii]OWB84078.1 hypothetical protein B5S33_g2715 [[Candida] boidinii]GMF63670.1 unnamed protein product [[Candida] boidinii]